MKNKILYRRKALIIMQKTLRGYLARKRHAPRIKGINKIKAMEAKVKQLDSIASQLKKDKESSIKEINSLRFEIESAISRIKRDERVSSATIDGLQNQLLDKVNNQMNLLQKKVQDQKNAEEQERLRKIREEMEAEKRRKEEEERQLREEEENRKKKMEIEARRKREEEERKKQVRPFLFLVFQGKLHQGRRLLCRFPFCKRRCYWFVFFLLFTVSIPPLFLKYWFFLEDSIIRKASRLESNWFFWFP